MRPNLSATAAESLKRINSLTTGSYNGVQTRQQNPNAPAISLSKEHGKLEINVDDTSPSGQFNPSIRNKQTNLALEISDIFTGSSNANSSNSKIDYSYNLPTDNTSTLLSAPSIPSKYAYALETPTTPKSTSTINNRLALKWWKAMQNEVSTFDKLDTTKLTKLPYERKAMGNKWVLTLKRNENGEPVRYKAQLVVQGFSQQPGIDFDKTFAPVVRLDSICTLVLLANNNNWDVQQLDVNAAYLHAPIEEDLYMQQIPYFNNGTDRVLKLKQSIYGLKQAGQMWNKFYNTKLKTIGYKPCLTNACVYQHIQELNGLKDAYPANTPLSPSVQLTRFKGTKPKFNYGTYIGTLTLGLTYCRSAKDFGKIGYSNADWGSNLIDSKKQATVALLTMEAKYMLLAHACTQALWLCQFFEELHLYTNAPTLILSDNIAALTLSVESQYHRRSKHINKQHHFMRNIIEQHKVSTLYVPTHENLANAFTKALPAPQFRYLMQSIMGEITETLIKDKVD
ncbi:Reverse transcriptase (RNA-dependent DNA polymerase) [Rhizoctonia solani]|uniref:Reverse transcriptase (RNA-dependent DNA polymerase) n=1 Tax=Rhizoctonia solani TaxID=456999 RepID=A0A8H7IC07_9AGAM|nr:Reverse transcriptase (RNA-dependent DNA polymerase) [Rhizoctonia solani]